MKAIILIIAASVAIFALAFGYDMYGSPQFVPAPAPIESADIEIDNSLGVVPEFSFETIDGRKSSIQDFRGKVVIINFWATWCSTCVMEMPDMLELVESYNGDVIFLAISSDSGLKPVNRFIDGHDDNIKKLFESGDVYISLDKNQSITHDIFMTERYPETIIIAPNGGMVRKIVGEFEWGGDEIKSYLDRLATQIGRD